MEGKLPSSPGGCHIQHDNGSCRSVPPPHRVQCQQNPSRSYYCPTPSLLTVADVLPPKPLFCSGRRPSVRYFHRGMGRDYNTKRCVTGERVCDRPNHHVQQSRESRRRDTHHRGHNYHGRRRHSRGGGRRGAGRRRRRWRGGDATFDGVPLPGPIEQWSRMLYHRIGQEIQKMMG